MSAPAGYSGTPLLQKLGYVPGKISYVDSIAPYFTEVRDDITLNAPSSYDFIHIFVKTPDELQRSADYATPNLNHETKNTVTCHLERSKAKSKDLLLTC